MTTQNSEMKETEQQERKAREITFKCKYCGQDKPLANMRTITSYFPPVVACSDCEKKLR